MVKRYEGDIGVCTSAVMDNFSCGISAILIPQYFPVLREAYFEHFPASTIVSMKISPSRFPDPFRILAVSENVN